MIWTAHVTTESGDHYIWVYRNKPTEERVINDLIECEGAADFEFYSETTSIMIDQTEIRE